LNPNYSTALQRSALLLSLFDRHEEALRQILKAVDHDPLSLIINTDVALIYFIAKDYQSAIDKCLTVLDIDSGFAVALFVAGLCYEQLKQYDFALDYFKKADASSNGNTIVRASLIHAMGKSGMKEEALKLLSELKNSHIETYLSDYSLACAYLGIDDSESAMECLEKAVEAHSVWLIHLHMKSDPRLSPLTGNTKFQSLMKKMGL
jgi:pentatricopeptide repeat protein